MPDTNKPPTLVAIGEGNVNKPTNTPDTEEKIKQIVEKVRYVEFLHGVPVELPNRTKELLRSSIREAISSRDTYWKERVKKEVEGMKKNENNLGFELKDKWKAEAHNQALDTLLDNLK